MRKLFPKLFVLPFALFAVLGCGLIERLQNTSAGESSGNPANAARTNGNTSTGTNVEDAARETLGLKKSGIPECDELIEEISKYDNANAEAEESYATRMMKEFIKQQIFDQLNKDDANRAPAEREQLVKACRKALRSYRNSRTK